MADAVADIGVLAGPGPHAVLEDARTVEVDTAYGPPGPPVLFGGGRGRSAAVPSRHSPSHGTAAAVLTASLPVTQDGCTHAHALDLEPVQP